MTTLYKVSTISEQILRFITRISELNDKIHEFQLRMKNLIYQNPDRNIIIINNYYNINGETIDQYSDRIIQKYHIAIANNANNLLTYLIAKVPGIIENQPSELPYYYPERELSEQ